MSILLSCRLSGYFLQIGSLDFSEFCHGARNLYEIRYYTARFFGKFFLPQTLWKWAKNKVFLNLKKNLVINFHSICSVMKVYFITCVPAQILYLGKIFFLRYRTKWSQSDCRILQSSISPAQIDKTATFLQANLWLSGLLSFLFSLYYLLGWKNLLIFLHSRPLLFHKPDWSSSLFTFLYSIIQTLLDLSEYWMSPSKLRSSDTTTNWWRKFYNLSGSVNIFLYRYYVI